VIDGPEDKTDDYAEDDGGHQGKGDAPVASFPAEVSGETAKRDVEARKQQDREADDDQEESERDEKTAKIGHSNALRRE
jgi:hypothetical protein